MQEKKELFVLSPFETPDVKLALESIKSSVFPILHLGRNKKEAIKALEILSEKTEKPFGVCFVSESMISIKLPKNVTKILAPFGLEIPKKKEVEIFYQVHSLEEIEASIKKGVNSIILKGNEGAGKIAYESSFVLFQGIKKKYPKLNINIYIQGGMGIHTSAAALALGAKGVIFDSQLALFPESSVPKDLKNTLSKLSGSETIIIDNFRILVRRNSPTLPIEAKYEDLVPFLGGLDLSENILPIGQDISLSIDLLERYKNLNNLVFAFHEAAYGHLLQAQSLHTIGLDNPLAKDIGMKYPIAQGPMARVSDVPDFAEKVANAGALPFIGMSLMIGKPAEDTIANTGKLLKDKPWGVGILGFAPPKLREEQMKYILKTKPPIVLIAGGRPSQAKPFEKEGMKVFLHVPSSALLDMFLKEGTRNFIFEGRESGGHVGPLASLVLWEKQIYRLLKEEDSPSLRIFFAGGIHDAFSSAFISIMSATLAAKGAKIGVLMGTSYLFTKEAVETGAILEEYQKQSISHDTTILLEAAPGQETRALPTSFTNLFNKEKENLFAQGLDSKEVWIKLEELNIGRLRVASKGVERQEKGLIKLNKKEQVEKGVYMVGQISALRNEVTTLNDLHTNVAVDSNTLISQLKKIKEPIPAKEELKLAIVGMSGIFPQARNIEEYWKNIIIGKDCVTEVPDSRWNKELFYNPDTRDTDYISSKWGGFIPTIDFDPLEFGIPPQSLASIEPVQLLSLLVAKRALEDAGYDMANFDGENTSVIIGAEGATELAASYGFRGYAKQAFGELPEEFKNALPKLNEDSFPGVLSNVVAGRITNRLNLGGSNFTVDAACASSLAAMDIACQELQNKRSDIVIVGGADLHNGLNDFLMFSATYALSKKGYCASFDADSDGIALGEGVAMVVLKRLEDAERDGDRIYAVIRGTGGSSDGRNLGMTAPNKKGQMKALQRAYKNAGILPSEVELIEAHGTGTVVGDRTELSALTDMFLESGAVAGQTHLGSVKTQIGHTKCAAGIAGVIKAALSIYYGVKPPTINLTKPNSFYKKETSPFIFNTKAGLWNSERRISGVSAFGFGGTNFHVILENYKTSTSFASALPLWPSELFVFRGNDLEEAKQLLQKVKNLLLLNNTISIKDIAYSLAVYNTKEIQLSIVAENIKELLSKIETAISGKEEQGIHTRNPKEGKVAFLFSGQGSQRVNMARDLFVAFPAMRKLLAQNKEYEKIIFPHAVFDDETRMQEKLAITDTRNTQPLLGMVDLAIANFLQSLGVEPDMAAGHSYGELPALCFAGVFDSKDLVFLSVERANAILEAVKEDKGMMAAVNLTESELKSEIKDEKEIWPVNFNAQKQIIIAGTTPAMTAFIQKMSQKNIVCKALSVDCAFHSPLLKEAKELFAKALKKVKFSGEPNLPIWSNTTADIYPSKENEIKGRLSEHLIQPVLFSTQIESMYAEGARIFIEAGPGRVLIGLAQTILGKDITTIQTEDKNGEGISFILNSLAKYIATGRYINVEKLFDERNASIINIDEPEQYKKRATIWHVNGHNALPSVGKLPPNGALPITKPMSFGTINTMSNTANASSSDQVMLDYLASMKMMIQNQRDVMLGYLGAEIPVRNHEPSVTATISQKTAPAIETTPAVIATTSTAPAFSVVQIKESLLEVVSEKTGYPVDMLGLDMDLEADLSIDSIKRMEIIGALREKLNITGDFEESEDAIERMASIKTLNGMIEWIEELADTHETIATTSTQITSVSDSNVSVITAPAFSVAEIKHLLLETVSEKTGYPVDMLGLDMDLEADLSIDSIKRMEIIGALREKLNITGDFEESEDAIERMASIKTLNGMIEWIEELANPKAIEEYKLGSTTAPTVSTTSSAISFDSSAISELEKTLIEEAQEESHLLRTRLELENWSGDLKKLSIKNKKFALTDDGSALTEKIKKIIEKNNAKVDVITGTEDLSSYDGLIILNVFNSKNRYTIKDVFSMIKNTNLEKIKWIYTFSDVIGGLANQEITELKNIQGFSGLLKSLAREFSSINFRSVISFSTFDSKLLPQIILDELQTSDISVEVIYKKSARFRYNQVSETLSINGKSNISLDKDSVVLVLGGAQGITAELTRQLSEVDPCHYILVGRSPKPSKENNKYTSLTTKEEIRSYLLKEEQMKIPAEIEKKVQKIYKENQITHTISNIEKSGSKVTYQSLDVSNQDGLRKFIRSTYKKYGRIDGVIHAAGLLVDKLFIHKTAEAFERVYSTKINPLHILLEELHSDIKFIVFFSSIASVYGNRGQSDYAAANSVFDLTSWAIKEKTKAKVLAINWGPWKGAGMVSDALEKEFKKRNVPMIPLKEGGQFFINELKYGKESQVVIMGGEEVKQFFGI